MVSGDRSSIAEDLDVPQSQLVRDNNLLQANEEIKHRDLLARASLMQLGKAMGNMLDIKKLLQQITHAAMAIVDADLCDILLVKAGSLEFRVASGLNKIFKGFAKVPLEGDPAAAIVEHVKPIIINDIHKDSKFHDRPWLNPEQFKSYMGVPIKKDDIVIGVLEVFSRRGEKFNYGDLKVLKSIAGPVAASLKNVSYFLEIKKRTEELKILNEHTYRILAERDIDKTMTEIVEATRTAVGSLMAAAALYNSDTGCFEHRTTNIDPVIQKKVHQDKAETAPYTEEVYAEILRTGRPIRLDDIKLYRDRGISSQEGLPLRGFLGIPLVDQNKIPCGLVMASLKKDGGLFSETDEEVLTTLANQASVALQNAYLYKQLEHRAKALKSLLSLSQRINLTHDRIKVLEFATEAVSSFFGAKSVCIVLYDEVDGYLTVSKCLINGMETSVNKKYPIDEEKREKLFKDKRPLLISSSGSNGGLKLCDVDENNALSYLEIPLVVQNMVIGVLGLSTEWMDEPQFDSEKEMLQIFANQVATAIDNSRLYEEALTKAENLATMFEVSKMVTSEIDLTPIFKRIALFIKKMFSVKHGFIFLSDRSGRNLELSYRWGMVASAFKAKKIPVDENSLIGDSFLNKTQIIIGDLSFHNPADICCSHFDSNMKSAVIIPLVVKGETCGVITLISNELKFFNDERLSIINVFANQSAIAIRNNQLHARVVEEEVARREAELSIELLEEKAKSSTVIEKTTEGVFMVDPDFKIQLFNPALESLTNRKADKVIGKICRDIFKDIFSDAVICDKCPLCNKTGDDSGRIRASIRHKSGELKRVEINVATIDYSGKKGVIGWVRDITKEHELEIYHHDLRIATEVQKNILPRTKPKTKGLDIGFLCKPARQIGGDYFDFIPLNNDRLGIAIGDVAGKSLPAALLVSMHKYILRSAAVNTSSVISPLRALNKIIWEDTSPEVFVTTLYGIYNPVTSTFVYANAGHLPPLLYSKGATKYLWSPQIPLGIQRNLFIEQHHVKLKSGDILVLLSDGVTDIMNKRRELYGLDRLRRIVRKYPNLDAQEIANKIFEVTMSFSTGELTDDFTIVVLKCTSDGEDTQFRDLVVFNKPVAANDVRKFVTRELEDTPFSKHDIGDILVSVCEAVTNSVLHGQSPDGEDNNIKVRCSVENDFFKIKIKDNGIGYNPNLEEWLPPDIVRDRGRGIFLMQNLMDSVEFLAGDRGTTLVLKKKLPASDND